MQSELPVIDIAKCINCENCILICPANAISKNSGYSCSKCIKYCLSFDVPCNPDHYIFCYEKCDSCGLCISACSAEAIGWHQIKL